MIIHAPGTLVTHISETKQPKICLDTKENLIDTCIIYM